MAYTIPSDTHVAGDPGHTTDHNNLIDVEGLVARAVAQSVNLGAAADPAGNAGNVSLIQSYVAGGKSHAPNLGLQLRTGGGTITTANITAAAAAGYTGMFLDPGFVWDMTGVVFNGIQDFTIESRMHGSIGWTGNVAYNTGGYIKTDTATPADGIQVYATTPGGGTATQGIVFRNCVFVGANTNAVVHFGGGNRRCGLVDCLVYNTASASTTVAVGSNGVAVSTFVGAQTLNVASTTGFPTAGKLVLATSTTGAVISYSGTTGTTFTNCNLIAGTGNLATGGSVQLAAFAVVNDSGLSDNNSEESIFSFTGGGGLAGAFAALGIGTGDQTQHSNDVWYYGMPTKGGAYSIIKVNGGGHTFVEHYDRSSPSVATVWNHGVGRLIFLGGEHQNVNGLSHLIDATASKTTIIGATITAGAATTCQVTAGSLILRGWMNFNAAQTFAVSGTGVIDMADPAVDGGNVTVSGSAGTLLLAGNYAGQAGPPALGSWTGLTAYPGPVIVASGHGSGSTTTQTVTWTRPLDGNNHRFRVAVTIRPTVAGTSTVPNLSYTGFGGQTVNNTIPMMQINAATLSLTCAGTAFFFNTVEGETNNGTANVVVTITPTGSTFDWSAEITQLT